MALVQQARLILSEKEVPINAKVHLYMGDLKTPEKEDGEPMVFIARIGGIPPHKKLYHIKDGQIIAGLEGFVESADFSPFEVYTAEDAPANNEYAVFQNESRRIIQHYHDDNKYPQKVTKGNDELVYDSTFFPFESSLGGIPMFEAQLRMYDSADDAKLKKRVMSYSQQIRDCQEMAQDKRYSGVVKLSDKGIQEAEAKIFEILEVLSRRHSRNPGELIEILQELKSPYLRQADLEPDCQLVLLHNFGID
ncbi:MAG: hypothetical protein V1740_04310 [Candidatus Woesearchaeota archaeon]